MSFEGKPFTTATLLHIATMLIGALILVACSNSRLYHEWKYDRPVDAESEICAANGVDAPCLRVINDSDQELEILTLGFPFESVDYGRVAAKSISAYMHVPKGVYPYASYFVRIEDASFRQGVPGFVRESPLQGAAFTYVINFNRMRRNAWVQLNQVIDDDEERVVRELATPTPTPRPVMNSASIPTESLQNTISCFTAQEIADAFFGTRYRQREGGDAPFIDAEGALVLHTTENEFERDTGHRRFFYDAPYESAMTSANMDLIFAMEMLNSTSIDRTCDTNVKFFQTSTEAKSVPFLETANLDPYLWNNRLLLIFAQSAADFTYADQLRQHAGLAHELLDRDMIWFHIFRLGPDAPNAMDISMGGMFSLSPSYVDTGQRPIAKLPTELVEQLRIKYNPDGAAFRVVLIGKDGGVKYETIEPIGPEQLFSIIDAMPMRQQEMQQSSP